MEDAHAAVLDLQSETEGKEHTPAPPDKRLAYFGVYDGHGGEKVAQFAGESIHKIIAKQEAFKSGDMEQALKDGFLATDRAILNGELALAARYLTSTKLCRPQVRRGSVRLHGVCWRYIKRQDLGGKALVYSLIWPETKGYRQMPETPGLFWESKVEQNRCPLTTSHKMKVCPTRIPTCHSLTSLQAKRHE